MEVLQPNLSFTNFTENQTVFIRKDFPEFSPLRTMWENGRVEIPLYTIIFVLSLLGNVLVILTLARNYRMRTNTNAFLFNLAVSDIILAVLCMPFTLVGTLLRNFIFGKFMCRLVPYLQATSVAVSVWTLVGLSVERYYAICHPLSSRRWQTLSHAYHLIAAIWVGSLLVMLPVLLLSELQPTNKGHHKCREKWPNGYFERIYNIFLDVLLLVIPLLALGFTYCSIAVTLWKHIPNGAVPSGLRSSPPAASRSLQDSTSDSYMQRRGTNECCETQRNLNRAFSNGHRQDCSRDASIELARYETQRHRTAILDSETGEYAHSPRQRCKSLKVKEANQIFTAKLVRCNSVRQTYANELRVLPGLRHTNYERSLTNKKRVIKMLCVVVLEFFICWTPLYVINTLALFWPQLIYEIVGYKTISFCHLLAYSSGCCNPITYCFMNRGFRRSFIKMFQCCRKRPDP